VTHQHVEVLERSSDLMEGLTVSRGYPRTRTSVLRLTWLRVITWACSWTISRRCDVSRQSRYGSLSASSCPC